MLVLPLVKPCQSDKFNIQIHQYNILWSSRSVAENSQIDHMPLEPMQLGHMIKSYDYATPEYHKLISTIICGQYLITIHKGCKLSVLEAHQLLLNIPMYVN